MTADFVMLDFSVGCLQKTEVVDARKSSERCNQTDVRAFRGFHWANPAVMRWVNVAHFKPGAVARQTARSKGGQSALMSQFGQRVNLVHELRELAPAKEVTDHSRQRFRVNQFLRRHGLDTLVEKRHA